MKKRYAFLICSLFITPAFAEVSAAGIMTASKFTGACGVMIGMVEFQESTKMAGGDEFIERFWNTELARLNYTYEEFLDICKKSIELHNAILKEAEKDD